MILSNISIDDFGKIDLRSGTILGVERVPKTDKLYRIKVDLGELGVRQTVSGIALFYTSEDLIGKRIVFVANLQPVRIAGEMSEGMLLAAEMDGKLSLVSLDREIPNGAKVH